MKLVTSLMPSRPRPRMMIEPNMKAGNAESNNDFAIQPGSTQMNSVVQPAHFSALSLQGSAARGRRFSGSESKRMDDHQKYRFGLR